MSDIKVTATLKDAEEVYGVYYGKIYGDTRGIFPDGVKVRTSRVKKVEGDLVYTQNSIYRLET